MSAEDRSRFDARFAAGAHCQHTPSPWLVALADQLPQRGRALDVAGGAGRNAIWLARRGLQVTVADISSVGLDIAADRAAQQGVQLETVNVDLEEDPFPPGDWDLVTCFMYLQRSLFPAILKALVPGGLLVFLQPTTNNLERHSKPSRRFLLAPNEVTTLLAGCDILRHQESWLDDHHEARVLARKPMAR